MFEPLYFLCLNPITVCNCILAVIFHVLILLLIFNPCSLSWVDNVLLITVGLPALACPANQTYVMAVNACLSTDIASQSSFLNYLLQVQACSGGVFTSLHELQRLRFCTYVTQSIIMVNMTEDIDPTIFWDINGIEGSRVDCIYIDDSFIQS